MNKADKVAHVLRAKQTREHGCHWPGCARQVTPATWGCKHHWFKLPRAIRVRIWNAYRPGQESDMRPNESYIEAAQAAQEWIAKHTASFVDLAG